MLRIVVATVLLTIALQGDKPRRPIVRQADHLQVESSAPRSLFDFFTDTLQLPVAWTYSETPGSAGGGFGAGNLRIQIFRPADQARARAAGRGRARYASIALEPYSLSDCLPELNARGVDHRVPEPYISTLPNRSQGTLWTTVLLTGLSKPAMGIFLYEYSPAFLNVHVRRNQLAGELTLHKGGPLGIVSVKEIVLATTDLRRDAAEWQRLLAPLKPTSHGVWKPGNGPAIRLVSARYDRIDAIVLGVRSLKQSRSFLEQRGMLGSARVDELRVDPATTQGLGIRLREE